MTRQVRFTGQTYGQATQQAQAQQAVAPGSAPTTVAAQDMASQRPAGPRPGERPFMRPTDRPNEAVTAGMREPQIPVVPPGIVPVDPVLDQLLMLYQAYPNDGLQVLLSKYWNTNA